MAIDYGAFAKQAGAVSSSPTQSKVNYSSLAQQAGAEPLPTSGASASWDTAPMSWGQSAKKRVGQAVSAIKATPAAISDVGKTVGIAGKNLWEAPGALFDIAKGMSPQEAGQKHFVNPIGAQSTQTAEMTKGQLKDTAHYAANLAYDIGTLPAKATSFITGVKNTMPASYDEFAESISPGSAEIFKSNNTAQSIGALTSNISHYFIPVGGIEKGVVQLTREAPALVRFLSNVAYNGTKDALITKEHGGTTAQSVEQGLMSGLQQSFGKISAIGMSIYQGYTGFNELQDGIKENDPTKIANAAFTIGLSSLAGKEALHNKGLIISPEARAAASQVKQSVLPTKTIGQASQNWLGAANAGKAQYSKFEGKRGKDLTDMSQFAIENGVTIGLDQQKKINSVNQANEMYSKASETSQKVSEHLDDNFPRQSNNLEEMRQEAYRNIEKMNMGSAKAIPAKANVDRFIDMAIQQNGGSPYLTDRKLQNEKSTWWSIAYNHDNPSENIVATNLGWQAAKKIEQNNPDLPIHEMNNLSGQYKNLGDFLASLHGQAPKGGRLGGMFNQMMGNTVMGAMNLVSDSGVPLISGLSKMTQRIVGAKIGQSYNDYMNDPERITLQAIKDAKKAGITPRDKAILEKYEAALVKRNIERKNAEASMTPEEQAAPTGPMSTQESQAPTQPQNYTPTPQEGMGQEPQPAPQPTKQETVKQNIVTKRAITNTIKTAIPENDPLRRLVTVKGNKNIDKLLTRSAKHTDPQDTYDAIREHYLDGRTGLLGQKFYDETGMNKAPQVFLDIDKFGDLNTKYSQTTGNDALKVFGALIEKHFPGKGVRAGGEEFFIDPTGISHADMVKRLQGLRDDLRKQVIIGTGKGKGQKVTDINFTSAFGVGETNSSAAMKAQKEKGRGIDNIDETLYNKSNK